MGLECYLKLKGINGECLDSSFRTKGVIQLSSCEFNGSAPSERERSSAITLSPSGWMSEEDMEFKPPQDEELSSSFRNVFSNESPQDVSSDSDPENKAEEEWPFTVSITKTVDSASPQLFVKYCRYANIVKNQLETSEDTKIESGKIWARKFSGAEPVVFLVWHFKEIQITSLSWRSLTDGDVEESITFRFRYVRVEYSPQQADGTLGTAVPSGWDLQTNTDDAPAISDSAVGV